MRLTSLLLVIGLLTTTPCSAQQPSIIDLMMRIKPALVEVTGIQKGLVKRDSRTSITAIQNRGAGVLIDPSGIIVTNAHVVNRATQVQITLYNGTKAGARILRFAPDLDLAILKIDLPMVLPAVKIANSAEIKLKDEIFTVGNSELLKESITGGRITGLASSRNADYSNNYESDFFEMTFDLYPGDSGGPLFNRRGELVGLITSKLLSKSNASFAISSNKISRYLTAVRQDLQKKP